MNNIDDIKTHDRAAASKIRKQAFEAQPEAGDMLCQNILSSADEIGLNNKPMTISVFFPMGSEIDTRPLMKMLNDMGHNTALPVVAAKASPLIFRAWSPGDPLIDGGFGTSIPDVKAPEVVPELLFVPLLQFDDAGYRLGYGGGFYDRTLEKLRALRPTTAVGIAFLVQRVDTVAHGPHDQKMDWIATEQGVQRIPEA